MITEDPDIMDEGIGRYLQGGLAAASLMFGGQPSQSAEPANQQASVKSAADLNTIRQYLVGVGEDKTELAEKLGIDVPESEHTHHSLIKRASKHYPFYLPHIEGIRSSNDPRVIEEIVDRMMDEYLDHVLRHVKEMFDHGNTLDRKKWLENYGTYKSAIAAIEPRLKGIYYKADPELIILAEFEDVKAMLSKLTGSKLTDTRLFEPDYFPEAAKYARNSDRIRAVLDHIYRQFNNSKTKE
jgi:hypothetical protein